MVKENIKAIVTLVHGEISTQLTSQNIRWVDVDDKTKRLELTTVDDEGRITTVDIMFFKQ